MDNDCLDQMQAEWPTRLGKDYLYNPETGLYCILGFALHCAGVPDECMLAHPDQVEIDGRLEHAADLAARLCGLSPPIWYALVSTNDGLGDGDSNRSKLMAYRFAGARKRWREWSEL